MRYLVLLGILLYFSFCLSIIFDVKPGRSLPGSFVIIFLSAYIPLLFGNLSYFKYLLFLFIAICGVFTLVKTKADLKYISTELKYFFNPSIIVFVLLYGYFALTLSNVKLSNTDDLGFWGTYVKDILRNGSYSIRRDGQYFLYSYRTYVPFAYTLETAIVLILKGFYHEPTLIFSFVIFNLSIFMFIFDKYKILKKDLLKIFEGIAIIIILTLCIQNNQSFMSKAYIYNSIYVDWILGIALGLGMYEIVNFDYNSNDSFFSFCVYLIIELTVKSVGQCLFLLLIFTLIVNSIIKKKFNKSFILKTIVVMVVPVLIYFGYLRYQQWVEGTSVISNLSDVTMTSSIKDVVESSDNIEDITNVIEESKLSAAVKFIEHFFKTPIYRHPFGISYFWFNTGIFILLLINTKVKKDSEYFTPVCYYLGSFAYALGIMLSYILIFGYEGSILVMYGRYMQTYTFAGLIYATLDIFKHLNTKKCLLLMAVTALFIEPLSINTIVYNKNKVNYKEKEIVYLERYLNNEYQGQKMMIINQTMVEYAQLIRNIAVENNRTMVFITCDEGLISYKEFEETLRNCELLFIGDYDNRFIDYWSKVTDAPAYNNTLYKVEHIDGDIDISIQYCWEWEMNR